LIFELMMSHLHDNMVIINFMPSSASVHSG
jgi:hypothetical protein